MRRHRAGPAVLAAIAAVWLALGIAGAVAYVHRYAIYRGFSVPVTPAGIPRGTVETVGFHSAAVGADSRYMVYLPPGYKRQAARGRRFPVLYLLHGYPGKMPVFVNVGAVNVASDVALAKHEMKPEILVMPAGKTGTLGADTEWADTPSGNWMSYLGDVVHDVDHRFATIPDRQHRGIAGDSLGGYGAMNVGLHDLREFSVIESWGGYFTQTPNGVFAGATRAALAAASPAAYVDTLAPEIRRLGLRSWIFQGRSDSADPQLMLDFAGQLHAAGADVNVGFFPGGHDWGLFRAQAPRMLIAASHWFGESPHTRHPYLHSVGSSPLPTTTLARIKAHRKAVKRARRLSRPAAATALSHRAGHVQPSRSGAARPRR
jgi:enterochelin esterase-like enzyme